MPPSLTGITARVLLLSLALAFGSPGLPRAQSAPEPSEPEKSLSFKVLVDQIAALFPVVRTEVVEVSGRRVTLASGRAEGVQVGVELVAFREGRELIHPTTKKPLGRTEEALGRLVVDEVFENYSVATQVDGPAIQAGDKARVSAGKVRLTVLSLTSGVRARAVETATYELVQELERTGRFQIVLGDQITVWLAQEKIAADEFMKGSRVKDAAQRFRAPQLLALHYTTVQGKPFMEVRFFSNAVDAPLLSTALFVPPSVKPRPSQQFSSGAGGGPVRAERRSLLARLLSGDFEPNQYSASAASIPIRSIATFPFLITGMDVAVAPGDKTPRIAITDGQKVFVYRLNNQTLEPEWTFDKRMAGTILSVQFADLDGDGVLEVVVNRQDYKNGMLSYILTTRAGRPVLLAEDVQVILLAVDETGAGVNRALWGQQYSALSFYSRGFATRYVLKEKDKDVAPAGRVPVHHDFRVPGATFSNLGGGKDSRVLAFVDERNRLIVTAGTQEMWRSSTAVGGGLAQAHLQLAQHQTYVDKFVKVEPNPVSVDLDGDGVQEIIIPVNQGEAGNMAVVFKGPAGYRIQVVSSGFEGMITGLGAIPGEGGAPPALVAAVAKRAGGFLGSGGETQLVLTLPE